LLRVRRERPDDCGTAPTQNPKKFTPLHARPSSSAGGILTAQLRSK
jgi:hypothetical protein